MLTACAQKAKHEVSPVANKSYKDDPISVEVAIRMAHSSYILGCMEAHKEHKASGKHAKCIKKADKHIKEDIIYIFDQDGKTPVKQ